MGTCKHAPAGWCDDAACITNGCKCAPSSKQMNFGDYCRIEQKRYVGPNEMYQYKVIGRLSSNCWVDVPVDARVANGRETRHDRMEEVIAAICCGVSEREVLRFRAVDCRPDETTDNERALRRLLAFAYSAPGELYGDDGELQNGASLPFIDFVRDSVPEIERKIHERGMRKLAAACSAVEPAGVRIAPEKPIIDGHPIGCMCHGCHYYRKHPQCKPVKASACDCEFGPASECSGGTKERDCTCDCHAMKDSEGCPHKAVGICAACEKVK